MATNIRQAHADDHAVVIGVVDEWWGGRRMAALASAGSYTATLPARQLEVE